MKKTLVFGTSLKSHRYSYQAVLSLVENGIETIGFGPVPGDILGVPVTDRIPEEEEFHTISLYMNSERQKEYYDAILSLRPERVIFNPGTENPDFYNLLVKNRIFFEEACTLTLLAIGQY